MKSSLTAFASFWAALSTVIGKRRCLLRTPFYSFLSSFLFCLFVFRPTFRHLYFVGDLVHDEVSHEQGVGEFDLYLFFFFLMETLMNL